MQPLILIAEFVVVLTSLSLWWRALLQIRGGVWPLAPRERAKFPWTAPVVLGLLFLSTVVLLQLWLVGRSIGFGFAFQPANVIALSDIPREKLARGSSFFNVLRQVATAFSTSFLATYIKDRSVPHYAHLAEQTTPASLLYASIRGTIAQAAGQGRWTLPEQAQVVGQLVGQLRLQAAVLAYRDALLLITGCVVVALVLAVFVGNPRGGAGAIME